MVTGDTGGARHWICGVGMEVGGTGRQGWRAGERCVGNFGVGREMLQGGEKEIAEIRVISADVCAEKGPGISPRHPHAGVAPRQPMV